MATLDDLTQRIFHLFSTLDLDPSYGMVSSFLDINLEQKLPPFESFFQSLKTYYTATKQTINT